MSWIDVGVELAGALLRVAAIVFAFFVLGPIVEFLRKKIADIDSDTVRKALDGALSEAALAATDAIRSTNQVLVDALRAKSEDGKLTKEEAAEAMRMAKEYFAAHLTSTSKRVLERALGPLEDWAEGFLEARLATEKARAAQAGARR